MNVQAKNEKNHNRVTEALRNREVLFLSIFCSTIEQTFVYHK
ncbi:hypothetical protein L479_02010 [Exiguobacterium sp. S17]|nr:hypothetical protein L479_02010 [Exiguobacterium sp. S17]